MDQKLQEHLKNLIRPLFNDADIFDVRLLGGIGIIRDFEVKVQWIITTDQSRPKKPSKILRIIFPGETIDDYQKNPGLQKRADEKIIQLIKQNLENFELDHDNPRSATAPVVEWVISTNVIY
jgi:hypothetical protein